MLHGSRATSNNYCRKKSFDRGGRPASACRGTPMAKTGPVRREKFARRFPPRPRRGANRSSYSGEGFDAQVSSDRRGDSLRALLALSIVLSVLFNPPPPPLRPSKQYTRYATELHGLSLSLYPAKSRKTHVYSGIRGRDKRGGKTGEGNCK